MLLELISHSKNEKAKRLWGIKLVITDELSGIDLNHVDHSNESDINFLSRLAKQNGAELAIKKNWTLTFKTDYCKNRLRKITGNHHHYSAHGRSRPLCRGRPS